MITDAQAETIRELDAQGIIGNDLNFNPYEIFPARNNQDNGHRRTCTSLVKAGLLVKEPHQPGRLRPVKEKAQAAYREWYQKRGYEQED